MINATTVLTKAHGIAVKTGNALAGLLVRHIQNKINTSAERVKSAEQLKSDVIQATALIVDQERTAQKSLLAQLKSAHRLVHA